MYSAVGTGYGQIPLKWLRFNFIWYKDELHRSVTHYYFNRERSRDDKKRDREEDEEDMYERRRLERRLRDKEAAYQEVCLSSLPFWFDEMFI